MISRHFDGGKSAKLEYKIRKGEDKNFNEKLSNISNSIQEKQNIKINHKSTEHLKHV